MRCPTMIQFSEHGQPVAFRCGSWYCEYCARLNARTWGNRTALNFPLGGSFMTLTMSPKIYTPALAYKLIPAMWDTFRKSIQRQLESTGSNWSYIAVVEGQPKRGHMPHFHIFANHSPKTTTKRASEKTALRRLAVKCGFGYQVDLQKLNDAQAGYYVAKYATKTSNEMPHHFRRVRTSQGFAEMPEFIHDAIILQEKREPLSEYVVRVSDITSKSVETLIDALDTCSEKQTALRKKN